MPLPCTIRTTNVITNTMKRISLMMLGCLYGASACSKSDHVSPAEVLQTRVPVVANATAAFEFEGKVACEMCVKVVNEELAKLPGISTIDVQKGKADFTVKYDSTLVKPDQMLALLKQKEPVRIKP
ncbi:MAG: hypothetical protein EXS02_02365 [Planctomycetes bacterium]|nr:hypothetical protein [Planctomycetota bacterium]